MIVKLSQHGKSVVQFFYIDNVMLKLYIAKSLSGDDVVYYMLFSDRYVQRIVLESFSGVSGKSIEGKVVRNGISEEVVYDIE